MLCVCFFVQFTPHMPGVTSLVDLLICIYMFQKKEN